MAKKIVSMPAQIQSMRKQWPGFVAYPGVAPETVTWQGSIVGIERPFTISIEYGSPRAGSRLMCREMPIVSVLSPSLILNPYAPEEAPLPHVYYDKTRPERSPLCLFDPELKQWSPKMYIANTILPWTGRWLASYEFWEATGRWIGGGLSSQATLSEIA